MIGRSDEQGWAGSNVAEECSICGRAIADKSRASVLRVNAGGTEGACAVRYDYCGACSENVVRALRALVGIEAGR